MPRKAGKSVVAAPRAARNVGAGLPYWPEGAFVTRKAQRPHGV